MRKREIKAWLQHTRDEARWWQERAEGYRGQRDALQKDYDLMEITRDKLSGQLVAALEDLEACTRCLAEARADRDLAQEKAAGVRHDLAEAERERDGYAGGPEAGVDVEEVRGRARRP